jgi:hypothetical protein
LQGRSIRSRPPLVYCQFHIEIDIKIRMVSFWPILLLGKETKLSYLSYKLVCTLSIEENVHFVTLGVDDFNFNSNLQNRNCIFSRLNIFTKSPNVRQLSYLSYKLSCTLSIEENVHFVWIKYLKELSDETGYSSIWINQDIPNFPQ